MVEGFCGLPASGKTYYLAKLGTEAIKQGRPVYANFKLKGARYFKNLREVFHVRRGLILVDEINLLCPSRFWTSFPPSLAYFWSQTRKFQLDIYWTAQHPDRVDRIIKEISNWIWLIRRWYFGIRVANCYLPEHVNKEKRYSFRTNYFIIDKKIARLYNTYELIDLPDTLQAKENLTNKKLNLDIKQKNADETDRS
jgi:hypothetical protein